MEKGVILEVTPFGDDATALSLFDAEAIEFGIQGKLWQLEPPIHLARQPVPDA